MTIVIQGSMLPGRWRFIEKFENGETVLEYQLRHLKAIPSAKLILATTDCTEDDELEQMAVKFGIDVVRGSYYNIPARLLMAGKCCRAEDLVRVNANSPLVDTDLLQKLYDAHVEGGYDYSYNEHVNGVLWGMGCDVFRVPFLERLCQQNLTENQSESIGLYLRQNRNKYHIMEYVNPAQFRRAFKLNIETRRDFEVVDDVSAHVTKITQQNVYDYLSKHPLIAQYNLESPSKEVGVEKLFFNQSKVDHILSMDDFDASYPISVEMTLTNTCNLNCIYCSDMQLRERQGMKEKLTLKTIKQLFDDLSLHGTKGVVLEGGGEPTLYPHFDEVVRYAKSVGLAVGLITNGTQRLPEDLLPDFEWIRVSLDASTQEEYVRLKGADCFERVLSNIAYYAKYCNTVGVGYVVTNQNVSQIEALILRLREAKAAYVQLRPVVDCDELYPRDLDLSFLKFYEQSGFGVEVGGMKENAYSGNHGLPCYAHSITSIISGDGSVFICGRLNIYDWLKPIGNITQQSFYDIWNGEERKKQAKMIHNGQFCMENCPQCRVSKFNELFDRLNKVKSRHFI